MPLRRVEVQLFGCLFLLLCVAGELIAYAGSDSVHRLTKSQHQVIRIAIPCDVASRSHYDIGIIVHL